jgi:regulator of replication initiation timing
MTALTGAQRQAAQREKKEAVLADLAASVSRLLAENDQLKAENDNLKNRLIEQDATAKKKIAALEKRLLNALEKKLNPPVKKT